MRFKSWIIFFLLVFVSNQGAYASRDAKLIYAQALRAAKKDQLDFSFMYYRDILRNYPDSPLAILALFAQGEYDYSMGRSKDAADSFRRYIEHSQDSEGTLFALAYLLKTSENSRNTDDKESIKKQIITRQQISFLFKKNKVFEFRSPLNQKYKAIVRINSVDFYKNEKFFTQITY